jgi:hypothetical protein
VLNHDYEWSLSPGDSVLLLGRVLSSASVFSLPQSLSVLDPNRPDADCQGVPALIVPKVVGACDELLVSLPLLRVGPDIT